MNMPEMRDEVGLKISMRKIHSEIFTVLTFLVFCFFVCLQEVLIAFMPYLKGRSNEATTLHEHYQHRNDQHAFLQAARDFLAREEQKKAGGNLNTPTKPTANSRVPILTTTTAAKNPLSPPRQPPGIATNWQQNNGNRKNMGPPQVRQVQVNSQTNDLESLERKMASLISDDDDPVVSLPPYQNKNTMSAIGSAFGGLPNTSIGTSIINLQQQQQTKIQHQQPFPFQQNIQNQSRLPTTPPRNTGNQNMSTVQSSPVSSSPFSSLFPPTSNNAKNSSIQPSFFHQQQQFTPPRAVPPRTNWGTPTSVPPGLSTNTTITSTPKGPVKLSSMQPAKKSASSTETTSESTAEPPKSVKKEYQPKRLWTHLEQQPGKILANNVQNLMGNVLNLRPRQELTAQWMLPLSYLRERASGKDNVKTLRDLLANLTVGLFRRGCTENGTQASIVSKEVLTPPGESRSDYPFQIIKNNMVVGTVPFYSPRTPGHVVFRLYWQNEPIHTLATGPTLNVRVTENDFESAIRFILSNFKGKKVNPTSLSSLNSFALVLEQFQISTNNTPQSAQHKLEGAGRAVWGCICEARKVLDACASEYQKTTNKLEKLEESVEELKSLVETEELEKETETGNAVEEEREAEAPTVNTVLLKEKQKGLISGRASCERKWRDSQLAFSSILKAIVTNNNLSVLLRRELITKMRLEYELWCPLCEEFAIPGDSNAKMWYQPLSSLPHTVTSEHFRFCSEARSKMQLRILGFDPNTSKLDHILYRRNRQMDSGAVNVFNQLSGAMGKLYQDVYVTADHILQQREMIRCQTEKCVNMCDCLPPGTKVAVFGSSANGFG
jgi:hypothetical protein